MLNWVGGRGGEGSLTLSCIRFKMCYYPLEAVFIKSGERERESVHGWEIAVILRNFRKTKLSKSKFLFFSFLFFFFFFFNSVSTYIQCTTRRFSLCNIRKYRFPAFYGASDCQAAIFF